jgi:hypothetical protein
MADPALLSNTIIGIQRETVRGTAPTTGVYNAVPFLDGISLAFESSPTEFDVYDGTRMKSFTVGGSRAVRLRIPTVLNYEQGQQDLLRAALHAAAWTGGAIVADADPGYFFTIVAKMELSTGDDYLIFTGCEVASATVDMPLNDKVSVNYDIFGLAQTTGPALPGSATLGALAGKSPFTTGFTGATVTWNALPVAGAFTASLTIDNQADPKYAWGGTTADHIINKNLKVSGTAEVYYRDDSFITDAIAGTLRPLTFILKSSETAAEDTFTINIPRALAVNAPVADSAGSMASAIDYRGQYDATLTSVLGMTVS